MSVKVIVAAHKPCRMPSDPLYLPLHVGAVGKEALSFAGDNTGDNISHKNSTFCELTGLYWAWKNLPDEYIGLVHYRRLFATPHARTRKSLDDVLTLEQAEKLLGDFDAILPKKRRYVIESLYSHYRHTCHVEPLDEVRAILAERHPQYVAAFDRLKTRTSAHMFNMFILRRDLLDAYCMWLFDVLFELEKRVDTSGYTAFHARFFGRVSELMLDVWLEQHPVRATELPLVHTEGQPWLKKGCAFLAAKFTGKKYEQSF